MSEKGKNLQPKQSGKPAMENGMGKPTIENGQGSGSHFTVGVVACCREAKLKGRATKNKGRD